MVFAPIPNMPPSVIPMGFSHLSHIVYVALRRRYRIEFFEFSTNALIRTYLLAIKDPIKSIIIFVNLTSLSEYAIISSTPTLDEGNIIEQSGLKGLYASSPVSLLYVIILCSTIFFETC